ncbi:MAG TPA: polysaccharide biosynthesis tyrosine autokinase [Pyrinomonadaceae bacterium]|jgi:capsular exopolysaccharide synthesis family protein
MEKDERLLPLPNELQLAVNADIPTNYSPIYDDETFNEKHTFREYFIIIYKRLPLILALTVLVTAAVAFYMYRQPSVYQAEVTLNISPPKPKITSKDSININFGNDVNYSNTQLKLLQNPDLMREVVIRLGLQKDPNLLNAQGQGLFGSLRSVFSSEKTATGKEATLPVLTDNPESATVTDVSSLTAEEKQRADAYAYSLLGGVTVEQVERTNLVNIRVTHNNPELAAKVANMTARVFIEQDIKRETQGQQKALEDLSKSIEDLQSTIQQQENQRIQQMRDNGQPLATKGEELAASILQQKSSDWLTAESDRRKIQGLYEAALRAKDSGQILSVLGEKDRFINSAREQNLKQRMDLENRIDEIDKQIQAVGVERAALLVKYTPEHPDVKRIEARIQTLEQNKETIRNEVSKKIKTEGEALIKNAEKEVLTGLQAQLDSARKREAQAQASYLSEVTKANQQGQAATALTTLTETIETNRSLLNTYIQRQKEQELALSSGRPDNIKITTEAQTPGGPIGPQRNRNIIIAFLVAFAAGIGLAFLIDYLDDSIRTSDDIGRNLGLPTLAMIPHQSLVDKKRGVLPTQVNGNGTSTALITLQDNRSAMAEAYRHLRTSLLFSSAGKPPQTILVTSTQPSEGKTTTAINTAVTLAQAGVDVVLLDCDLRRPRLHQHFSLSNTSGLTNYLSGERNTENLLKSYPGLPNLKVVTSGPIPPNPAELLSSNEMKNLLQFLKGNFKHVVIDSPPAISFTDAAIMATLVDGVVLVAMAGKSSIHLMRRFKHRLANLGARIYGVVLNGIKPSALEYGYYGYGHGYTTYYDTPLDDETTPHMEEEETVVSHTTKG